MPTFEITARHQIDRAGGLHIERGQTFSININMMGITPINLFGNFRCVDPFCISKNFKSSYMNMKEIIIKRFDLPELLKISLGPVMAFSSDKIVFVGIPESKTLGKPFVEVKPSDYDIELPENYRLYRGMTSLEDGEIENLIEGEYADGQPKEIAVKKEPMPDAIIEKVRDNYIGMLKQQRPYISLVIFSLLTLYLVVCFIIEVVNNSGLTIFFSFVLAIPFAISVIHKWKKIGRINQEIEECEYQSLLEFKHDHRYLFSQYSQYN